ncbi:MAG: DUF1997 domain-containing protein [Candidatus Sericytochromatia bacterium]|nr:DUF1997 domain-containing protein [Candidatus Tanganyikabacteria bacterium]
MLELEAQVAREFRLPEPPERVVTFVRHNEALLHRILGADRVARLSPAMYRFVLGRYGAFGFTLVPALDMVFERVDDLLLQMTSVGCQFLEATHRDFAMDAGVSASAVLRPISEGTAARIEAITRVNVEVPAFLRLVPRSILTAAGNAVIEAAMQGFADRIIPIVRDEMAATAR